MKEKLKEICHHAGKEFAPLGLDVTGCHYFIPQPPQTLQKKLKGVCLCLDATTNNLYFFGKKYDNRRRIKLLELTYTACWAKMAEVFPDHEILLDTYVTLKRPYARLPVTAFKELDIKGGFVDVTSDENVYFVELEEALKSGEIEEGATVHRYCKRYDLKHILKHGKHIISPDSSSVEAFDALCSVSNINSVLEIGAGVGTCGVAAQRRGIIDFTFLDASPKVCEYLKANFRYPVIQKSALNYDFWREGFDGDVVLMGMPYEHNPHFLSKQGWGLFNSSKFVVFQSGCTAFFEFEHDWLSGKKIFYDWPWWQPEQNIPNYFQNYLEMALEWQTCIVASQKDYDLARIKKEMERRGFTEIKYEKIEI